MSAKSNFVAFLLTILVSFPDSETANITTLISKPPSPSYAVEGKNFTLDWTYTLDGAIGSAQFIVEGDGGRDVLIGRRFSLGSVTVTAEFQARFRAQATETRAELTILAVQRSDKGKYKLTVLPTGSGSIIEPLILVVNFSSKITNITGQNVTEGGNVTLKCFADGQPTPTITWIRLSDNGVVTMPLIHISRHDSGAYRCTADNGVGIPATREVSIDVQYKPDNVSLDIPTTEVCAGVAVIFTCSAGDANPAVKNYTLYKFVDGPTYVSSSQTGVFIQKLYTKGPHKYRCEGRNSLASTSSSNRSLEVLFPASVTIENGTIVVLEGRNVTLHCFPSGYPSPNISWIDFSNCIVEEGSILKFLHISRRKNGSYTCSAANACGSDQKKVDVVVEYPPKVNGSGQNATVAGGVEYTFSCPVDGNPVPSITWYSESGTDSGKQFKTRQSGCYICVARNVHGISDNITQCLIINSSLPTVPPNIGQSRTLVSSITVSQTPSQITVFSTTASQGPSSSSTTPSKASPHLIIIIAVAGGVVLLAILVGVLTLWVHKRRKCRKDTKIHNSDLGRHDDEGGYSQVQGAYAQSGPPAASGGDGAIAQEVEVAAATPTYAVVDKSKKKKNKKLREEVPPVYAEVDKSKKKKKKVDDKNLYEILDEPKKARKPGELLYADLGDFQNPGISPVSISPQPLPAIKIPEPYERTDYADITQFHKGNAKMPKEMPQNDGNEDTEMKPKRPSKKKIQGNDNETGI